MGWRPQSRRGDGLGYERVASSECIGYDTYMMFSTILRSSRQAAGLTQSELAALTGIARPNITAYESGRREPRFTTATNLLTATGASWQIDAPVTWSWTPTRRPFAVPSNLWRLPTNIALRRLEAGTHLWWSGPPRTFDLAKRDQRLRAYEIVLREGGPDDIASVVDDILLHDAWSDLTLPHELRDAWEPLIDSDVVLEPVPARSR